jgi:CelD/BcsL family acetyltransferase involved in cellulose biosynthesis
MINQVTLEELKSHWTNPLQIPFLTWAWHNNWQTVFGDSYKPFYLLIDNTVIAPFVKNGQTILWSGGEEIADYLDLIGPDEAKASAWPQIIELLKKENISSLNLRNVPENSPTISFFKSLSNATVTQEDTTPTATLPATWDAFVESLPSRKYRHELERKIRKFENEHLDAEIIVSTNPGEDINILISLMEKDEAKKTFLTPTMKTMFTKTAAIFKDTISLLLLKMGDKYAAATLSFVVHDTYYLYNSGFDKDCCPNAGFYLKSMGIKYAIEHGGKIYNFLQGSERYKYELGGKDFFVYSIKYNL